MYPSYLLRNAEFSGGVPLVLHSTLTLVTPALGAVGLMELEGHTELGWKMSANIIFIEFTDKMEPSVACGTRLEMG